MNLRTLESIVDAADVAFRRRLLMEKYPQLETTGSSAWFANIEGEVPDDADGTFSVIDELSEAGGPDLRAPEPDITQKPDDLNQTAED